MENLIVKHIVGQYHVAEQSHIEDAIATALEARKTWSQLPWEQRAAIFLKAADLIAGPYRAKINAATMIAQSKTVHQAEIDAACELIDFLRFNVQFMTPFRLHTCTHTQSTCPHTGARSCSCTHGHTARRRDCGYDLCIVMGESILRQRQRRQCCCGPSFLMGMRVLRGLRL